MHRIIASMFLFCAIAVVALRPALAVTIDWSPVGNPGNANDPASGNVYGAVAYNYRIGTYDVTNNQYTEFLNTKDPTGGNALGLWNEMMTDEVGGINYFPGNAAGSKYAVISGRGQLPVFHVSWYDAIRFANWINNGQGTGSTETGAYTLGELEPGGVLGVPVLGDSIVRNSGASVFLPSTSEWYKAAFYDSHTSSYFLYPTSSSTTPIGSAPTALPNHANFNPDGPGTLTNVGAYTGTTSPYGAFDMGGNTYQWTEELINGVYRAIRGGNFGVDEVHMRSTFELGFAFPYMAGQGGGFRLASVPEPSSLVLAALGLVGLVVWRRRKRR
jgi:formylglycine-generating enzyme